MTVYGFSSLLPVTMDLMVPHTQAVRKGAPNTFLIGDLPFLTYEITIPEAIRNAGRYMAECGCDAVKLEGGDIRKAVGEFINDIENGKFPDEKNFDHMPAEVNQAFQQAVNAAK
jgi:3-methyl-2-oxobutanoate hydroxymethyltransferase